MSRKTSRNEYRRSQALIAAVYLLLVGILTIATASAETAERSSLSKHFAQGGRVTSGAPVETLDQFAPLATDGERTRSADAARSKTSGESQGIAAATANDFWIFDADVVLFGDDDNDGFFFGVDVLFDADTIWSSADVYAVLYLSYQGGPWNEYAITEDFRIFGASGDDEYVIVTELQSGYPTGDYDLLIELFDAVTGEFLTDFGPESSSELGILPLEDFNRDAPIINRPTTVSRGHGGGSAGIWTLLMLAGTWLRTAHRMRHARRLARHVLSDRSGVRAETGVTG